MADHFFPLVKSKAARTPPIPDPATTSKKSAMWASGFPDLRRREDSRWRIDLAAKIPSVAPPPSMERILIFPVGDLICCDGLS